MKRFIFIFILTLIPLISLAAIVPECKQEPCQEFGELIQLARNILEFFFIIGTSIAAIAFAWAGIIYITAGGNPSKAEQAKKIFLTTILGYIIVLAAWFIVDFILDNLTSKDYSVLEG